jgi:hypothetical protein
MGGPVSTTLVVNTSSRRSPVFGFVLLLLGVVSQIDLVLGLVTCRASTDRESFRHVFAAHREPLQQCSETIAAIEQGYQLASTTSISE